VFQQHVFLGLDARIPRISFSILSTQVLHFLFNTTLLSEILGVNDGDGEGGDDGDEDDDGG